MFYCTVNLSKAATQKDQIFIKTNYRLMQARRTSAILSTFIKLPFVIKILVLSNRNQPYKCLYSTPINFMGYLHFMNF